MNKNVKTTTGVLVILAAVIISVNLMQTEAGKPIESASASVFDLENQIKNFQTEMVKMVSQINILNGAKQSDPDTVPPLLMNLEPEYERTTSSTAILTWHTDELSDSKVTYSPSYINRYSAPGGKVATSSELVTFHKIKLEGLKPNTKYYYYVTSADLNGNTSSSNTHSIVTRQISY